MADEKNNREGIEDVKAQAAAARDALKDAATAIHGLNRSLSNEAYKGMKDVAGKAAEMASSMAEVADPLTRGAASRMNDVAQKVADAAGEAFDRAHDLATETYDKAFAAVAKRAENQADSEAEVVVDSEPVAKGEEAESKEAEAAPQSTASKSEESVSEDGR